MSTARLTSFALYKPTQTKPGAAPQILTGASRASISASGRLELEAASVPTHSVALAKHLPTGGLLMLYGLRDAMLELQRMRSEARRVQAEFAYVDLEVDLGTIESGLVDRQALQRRPDLQFLAFRRMKADLQLEILQRFHQYAQADGSSFNDKLSRTEQIASRPDLWDRLCDDDDDFRHLKVIIIPLGDSDGSPDGVRYVAYARPGLHVVTAVQGSDHVALNLPAWMAPR